MIDFDIKYVRGILFVRLEGNLNKKNSEQIKKEIIKIIKKGGLKYISFNLVNAKLLEKISLFDECNLLAKENGGKIFICGLKSGLDSVVSSNYDYCDKINNELSALKIINAC